MRLLSEPGVQAPQKEGGCELFFLSYDSPAERSCSRQELPPLAVGSVERDSEDRGEDDEHVFPPHNTPAVGQEGGLGIKAQNQDRRAGCSEKEWPSACSGADLIHIRQRLGY